MPKVVGNINQSRSGRVIGNVGQQTVQPEQSLLESAANIIAPATSQLGRLLGTGAGQFSPEYRAAEQSTQQAEAMRQQLVERAARETDPQKKALLVNTILSSGQNLTDAEKQLVSGFQQTTGLTDKQMQMSPAEFAGRQAVSVGSEVGSYLLPGGQVKGATALQRVGQAALRGAGTGALSGLGSAAREAENFGEGASRIATGAAVGAVVGAGLQGAGETIKKVFPKGTSPEAIDLSERINETKRAIKEGDVTIQDRLRSSQFLKYKNKSNDLINEVEVARILDDVDLKYNSTDQLGNKAKNLATALENVKINSLKSQGGKIDVSEASNIFYRDASRSLKSKTELDKLLKGIVRESTDIQGLKGADPVDANKLASDLGKEARLYYAQWQRTGDPAAQHLYLGLNNAKNYIRDQIDTKFSSSITYTPEQLAAISKLSPKLAKAVQDKTISMADINYIQAMMNNANSLAKDTTLALSGAGQQVLSGKGMINIPILSQVSGVVGQGADVLLSPLQALTRTQTARGTAGLVDLLGRGASTVGNISSTALKEAAGKPAVAVNPALSAIQRMIQKEQESKQERKLLK